MTSKPSEILGSGRWLGEEFLMWLWMKGIQDGGTSDQEGDFSACFLDDQVQLVSERGEVKEIGLKKGNPAECLEAFEALSRGMRPSKAKIRILSGDMEWTFSLTAATLDLSALKLPPAQSKDRIGLLADRLFLLEEGLDHIDRRLRGFLNLRTEDPDAVQQSLLAWIQGGLSRGSKEDEDAPWEG